MPDGPLIDVGAERDEIEAAARDNLARAVDGFDVKRSHCHLVEGRPNDVIPRTARRERCSIVAMGVVSRSGLKRFFIGNTAEFVMDAVTADILVVKPAGFRFARAARRPRRADPVAAHPARLRKHEKNSLPRPNNQARS